VEKKAGEKTASSRNGGGKNWFSTCRFLKLDSYLLSCTKISSKYINHLNLTPALPQEKRENSQRYRHDYFLNRPPTAQKVDKWDCFKLKCFCISIQAIIRIQRQPTE
jgi:hypothetical protein